MRGAIMRTLAPLSYLLAWAYLKWATSRTWGRVDAKHPDAAEVGRRIYEYERLLGIRGKTKVTSM